MQRLAQFDVSRQFLTGRGKIAAQITFGMVCAAAMIGVRSLLDIWYSVSGAFALVYPAVLLATLYGHWRAGIVAFLLSFAWAWYIVLPAEKSFAFLFASDPAGIALNGISALIVLVFAEAFRRAASSTMSEIRAAADRRLVLLAELEHRTKNNFALVASLLEIQKRRLGQPDLDGPLDDAVHRVRTFAEAYSNLAMEQDEGHQVSMKAYLEQLLDRIERAALPSNVELLREIDDALLPRETGVAIGLYLNEAITNCGKYAFPEGAPGTIAVFFTVKGDDEWSLVIEDNGVGVGQQVDETGGIGSRLMEAFATQARARHQAGADAPGFRSELSTQPAD